MSKVHVLVVEYPGSAHCKAVAEFGTSKFNEHLVSVRIEAIGTSRLDAMNRLWNNYDECFGQVGNAIHTALERESKEKKT